MGEPAVVSLEPESEWGLRLPNGRVVWPPEQFYGTGYQTEQERGAVANAIAAALDNMSLPRDPNLGQYGWVRRERQTVILERTIAYDIDDADVIAEPHTPTTYTTGDGQDEVVDTVGGGYVQS